MEITVKSEPIEDESSDEFQMNVEIKEEKELIIESDIQWLPTKFENEENEYYQEFFQDRDRDKKTLIKKATAHEEDTIEYVDESDDFNNIANDYNSDLKNTNNNDLEQSEENKKQTSSSEVFYGQSFKAWSNYYYIKRKCPECNKISRGNSTWRDHIQRIHWEEMKASDVNFDLISNNAGVCKICKQEVVSQFSRYLHSLNHTRNSKLELNVCKLCNYTASQSVYVNNHIAQKHPEVIKEFEKSCCSKQNLKCPLCCIAYNKLNDLMYHFMDRHPQEYLEKFIYNCNLCHQDSFSGEELFLQHLMEEHKLNSWQVLNYQKIFDDKEYMSCLKCHRLYFKNDVLELLKHFLSHTSDCYWTCKFCCQQIDHTKSKKHLCSKMINYFEKKQKQIKDSINLKEFEEYISHVCPFCKMEFGKMIKWQHHLRTEHQIDTLKGLEMKVFANSKDKLICTICHTVVGNIPEHLHAHRFQHLPYMPYKCLQCAQTLDNFKTAVNHVLKRCQDQEDRDCIQSKNYDYNSIHSLIKKQCPLCTNQIFSDVKSVSKHYEVEHSMFKEFFIKNPDMSVSCIICKKQYAHYDKKTCFTHLHIHFGEKSYRCSICQKSYITLSSCITHLQESHLVKTVYKKVIKQINKNIDKKVVIQVNKTVVNKKVKEVNKKVKKENKKVKKEVNKKVKKEVIKKVKKEVNKKLNNKVSKEVNKPVNKKVNKEVKSNKITSLDGRKKQVLGQLTEFAEFITYACPECNENLSTQEEWYTHMTTLHDFFETSNVYFKDNDGSLKCTTCKKKLSTSLTDQQKHKLSHMPYRSFICNLCYNRCNTTVVLRAHMRRRHFTPGNYECRICSKTLVTSHQRTVHLKQNHPFKEWPEGVCLICYHISKNKFDLNKHMDIHDRGVSSYTCYVCSLKLIGLKDFILHMATHNIKDEIKENEKMATDIASHSGSTVRQSHGDMDEKNKHAVCDQVSVKSEKQDLHKRKISINSSEAKKAKP